MAIISLIHKEHGIATVDEEKFNSTDTHGWAKKDAEARGWRVATAKEVEADAAAKKQAEAEALAAAGIAADPVAAKIAEVEKENDELKAQIAKLTKK